jgi:replicative DNA helicase
MSAMEVGERLLATAARVSTHRMRVGTVGVEERRALADAAARFQDAPLHLDDSSHVRVSDIAASVRQVARQPGNGNLGLIIIDYLQLIEPDNPQAARHEQVAQTTRRLKQLGKDAHCPVLCLCQLGRQVAGGQDDRPCLNDLRESGAIEQDADVVLFVHRPEH